MPHLSTQGRWILWYGIFIFLLFFDFFLDAFVRSKVLPYIGASNALNVDQIQTCLNNHFDGVTVYKQYYQICDKQNSTCSAFLAVSPNDKAIVLSYEGSKGLKSFYNVVIVWL